MARLPLTSWCRNTPFRRPEVIRDTQRLDLNRRLGGTPLRGRPNFRQLRYQAGL